MHEACSRSTPTAPAQGDREARLRVADVLRQHGPIYAERHPLGREQRRLLRDVAVCRTAALGGHLYECTSCGHEVPMYNSCRNRACPNCQALEQGRWIDKRTARLLPVGHHHVVFTLPSQLRPLARRHPRAVFSLLFRAARETLSTLASDEFDGQLGVTAVLHTWTRKLLYHPHLHCIVTAGALSRDGTRWIPRTRYLLPVARIKALFRARILCGLERLRRTGHLNLEDDDWTELLATLPPKKKWVVYMEAPFGRSTHVLQYLGRYTHRIAISDHRLVAIDDHGVRFRTHGDDTITLTPKQFVARFLQHVLPARFHKIRHFGLYAPACINGRLQQARALIEPDVVAEPDALLPERSESWSERLARLTGRDPLRCPACDQGTLQRTRQLPRLHARGPPIAGAT